MATFQVDYEAFEPRFGDITITGVNSSDEAEDKAIEQLELKYPEWTELDITGVTEIE